MMGLPWMTGLAALASRPATSQVTSELGNSKSGITRNESSGVSYRHVGIQLVWWEKPQVSVWISGFCGQVTTVKTSLLAGVPGNRGLPIYDFAYSA